MLDESGGREQSLLLRRSEGKLPLHVRLSFATGHILNVLGVAGIWYAYGVAYYSKVLRLSPASVGTIVLAGQAAGALSTPLVGSWSDNSTGCRYGRRKVFHLMGIVAFICSFFFLWHECLGCSGVGEPYQVLYFSCFAAVFEFGWTAIQVSTLSLVPELTRVKSRQVELNSMRYGVLVGGTLFVFVSFWILLDRINNGSTDSNDLTPKDKKLFWIMALAVTAVGFVLSLPFQVFIREKKQDGGEGGKGPTSLPWYRWMLNPLFYMVICAFISNKVIALFTQAYLPFYLLDTLEMDRASIAKGPLFFYISSFIVTVFVKRARRFTGDKMAFFLGLALVWACLIWLWVKQPTGDHYSHFNLSRDAVYLAIVLLGAGSATIMVISYSFIGYLVQDYLGSSGFVYACALFGDRLSNGVLIKIATHTASDVSKSELPEFYRGVLVYVGFGASGLGLLALVAMSLYSALAKWKRSTTPAKSHDSSSNVQLADSSIDYSYSGHAS